MSTIEQVIAHFGESLGITGLTLPEQGTLNLQIERIGNIYLERGKEEILLYMTRELSQFSEKILQQALVLCHIDQGHPYHVQIALQDKNTLVFLVRLAEHEVILPVIEQVISLLRELHDKIATV